jgi:hypothetical protein
MASRFALMVSVDLLIVATWWGGPAVAQTMRPAFDPAAAVGMLADATENENTAAAPFVGLASQVEADRLFGTATTTIPIELPPERKGMAPDLTIRYSSNAGNGPLGVGRELPLGSIRRNTARGLPLDYGMAPVGYTDAPGFVLLFRGGTILLDTCQDPGSCTYWSASSEEAWLDAQFVRGSNYWKIRDKDGVTYTYGAAPEARTGKNVSQPSQTFGWSLTDIEDPNRNTVHVTYVSYDNALSGSGWNAYGYPTQVDYGRAKYTTTFTDVFHVALTYVARPDVLTSYRGGFEERISRRLSTITVTVDGAATNPVRQYQIAYQQDPDTGLSLLAGVSLTAGTLSLPSTAFTYSSSARGLKTAQPLSFVGGTPCAPTVAEVSAYGTVGGFVDIDADGLPEFVEGFHRDATGRCGPNLQGHELWRNRGGGVFEKYTGNGGIWTGLTVDYTAYHIAEIDFVSTHLGDMNGDGWPDVVQSYGGGATCPVSGSTCSWLYNRNLGGLRYPGDALQATTESWPGVPADLGGYLPMPLPGELAPVAAQLIDLNADGRPDILDCAAWAQTGACAFYPNTGTSFGAGSAWPVPAANDATAYDRSPLAAIYQPINTSELNRSKQLVDLNGDGLPDLVSSRPWTTGGTCVGGSNPGATCTTDAQCSGGGRCAGHWDLWLNTGSGFASAPLPWPAPPFGSAVPYDVDMATRDYDTDFRYGTVRGLRDLNGDGLPDYVDATTTPWTVYLNTGARFATGMAWAGTQSGRITTPVDSSWLMDADVLDLNGDGLGDSVYYSAASGGLRVQYGDGARGNLLKTQTNGLGASCEVSYAVSTDPVTAGTGCMGGTNAGAPCLTSTECPGSSCAASCANCSQLPFPAWVVQSVRTRSGFSGAGHDLTTQFTFTGGFFDPMGHQFRGFRQSVETRTSDGRKVRRRFAAPPFATSTSPPWPASVPPRPFKLIDEQVLDGTGKVLTRTMIDWGAADKGNGRFHIHPTKRVDTTSSTVGTSTVTRTQTFDSYDDFNNLTADTLTGDLVPKPIQTTSVYGAPILCRSQPTKITVAEMNGSSSFALSERSFAYDLRCNLTSASARLAPSGQPATGGTVVTTTTLEYDQTSQNPDAESAKAGQPTRIKDALNNATKRLWPKALVMVHGKSPKTPSPSTAAAASPSATCRSRPAAR